MATFLYPSLSQKGIVATMTDVMSSQLKIDFSEAPHDPLERLMWLSGAKAAFDSQVSAAWQEAYFEARLTGRFPSALNLNLHSRKRALAFTRAENERRGRPMRWGDGF